MPSRELKSLDQLMDGALVERFNAELAKLWDNIFDMRTDPRKTRAISIIFKFIPNERRDAADMVTDVNVKLLPPKPLQQTVLMHQHDDGTVLVSELTDQIPGQMDIEGDEQPLPQVVEFKPPQAKEN